MSTSANARLRSALRLLGVPREGDAEGQVGFRARKPEVLRRQMESAAREITAVLGSGPPGVRAIAQMVIDGTDLSAAEDALEIRARVGDPGDHVYQVQMSRSAIGALLALRDALSVGPHQKSS